MLLYSRLDIHTTVNFFGNLAKGSKLTDQRKKNGTAAFTLFIPEGAGQLTFLRSI